VRQDGGEEASIRVVVGNEDVQKVTRSSGMIDDRLRFVGTDTGKSHTATANPIPFVMRKIMRIAAHCCYFSIDGIAKLARTQKMGASYCKLRAGSVMACDLTDFFTNDATQTFIASLR
jgi:hypothetical protein